MTDAKAMTSHKRLSGWLGAFAATKPVMSLAVQTTTDVAACPPEAGAQFGSCGGTQSSVTA